MRVGRRSIDVTRRDKLLFPASDITKGRLVDYYRDVAEDLLRHARGRLVTMQRLPDGLGGDQFYQKAVPDYFPRWIRTETVKKEGGTLRQVVLDDAATLVYLADQACITPHIWLSPADRPRHPDRMIIDLDPPGEDYARAYSEVRWAARRIRGLMEDVGLESFVMTTGSRGLHVLVPLRGAPDFDTVRSFAADACDLLVARYPQRLTRAQRKADRGDRIYLDVMRNAYAQTTVAPYAVRAREGAPVATPLDWAELGRSGMGPRHYTVDNLFKRLARKPDPWKRMGRRARSLDDPRRALVRLVDREG